MPTVHKYRERDNSVEAIQIHPSARTEDIEKFCPVLHWNGMQSHGTHQGNGIHFPGSGRPVEEHPDRPFFWVNGEVGHLYDWVARFPDGMYMIVPEDEFARKYVAA